MNAILKNSFFLIISLYLLTLAACAQDADAKKTDSVAKAEATQTLPKLLDLGANECIPCKKMAPILEELKVDFKGEFDVEFIDVWQPENEAKAKDYGIQLIPTQIFFDAKGVELWRHEGFISREDILEKWQELGFTFTPVQQDEASPESAAAQSE